MNNYQKKFMQYIKSTRSLSKIKLVILAIVIGLGANYALATVWMGPSTTAPGGNPSGVINTSSGDQAKAGPIIPGSLLDVNGGLSAQNVAVWGSAVVSSRFYANSLNQTNVEKPLCVDASHKLIICSTGGGAVCGNSVIEGAEDCDDGNTVNGDGCSSTCMLEAPPSGVIGNVFVVGPHMHGGILGRKVVYVGQPIHPTLTVHVKNWGSSVPYNHTTDPAHPNSQDAIYTIPQGYFSSGSIQYSNACTGTDCTVGLEGANYATVTSVSGANVSMVIPLPYHVCKYDDAPGQGVYFSPGYYSAGTLNNSTCPDRYPDAEVVN